MAGYVNTVRAIVCSIELYTKENYNSMVCSELPAREASNLCEIWKLTSCDFIPFISSLIE